MRNITSVLAQRETSVRYLPRLVAAWTSPLLAGAVIFALATAGVWAAEDQAAAGSTAKKLEQTVSRGVAYLTTRGQAEDGSYSAQTGTGVTALCTTALMRNGLSPNDPAVAKSLKYLEERVTAEGGIFAKDSLYGNYETCLAIMCFVEANRNGRYDKLLGRAEGYVKGEQFTEGQGKDKADMFYGGAGYGRHKRPDLSNTSFLLDALKACGRGPDDEAVKKALVFVSRCQNFESEQNTSPHAAKNPDGGFYYTAAAGGSSMAGETPDGGLRSYASMTYAGLKSMVYAGVGPDDPRAKAAMKWIKQHYDLETNPGMDTAGLFYYYHVFAKTLAAMKVDEFEDAKGVKHDWRRELIDQLARRQQANGSWINENKRWMEDDANLVTGYALLALSYCRPAAEKPAK